MKTTALRFSVVWTEIILQTELLEDDDIRIVVRFPSPSCPQT